MDIAGKFTVKANGSILRSTGENDEYSFGNDERTGVPGSNGGSLGFEVKPNIPYIQFECADSADLKVADLIALSDVTITKDLSCGKTVQLTHATQVNKHQGTASKGRFTLKFESGPGGTMREMK